MEEKEKKLEQENTSMGNLATELLQEVKAQTRRWMIAFFVVIALWAGTIAGFLIYMYQYDFSSYDIDSQDGGNANFIGNDGDINNGENKSPYEEEEEREGQGNGS